MKDTERWKRAYHAYAYFKSICREIHGGRARRMKLNKQDARAQRLAKDIAELIQRYEADTGNRIDGMSIAAPYDVQLHIRLTARSLDTFTHDTRITAAIDADAKEKT